MKRHIPALFVLLTLTGCAGPSKEELYRQQLLEAQRAEQAALQAQQEAQAREARISERRQQATAAWTGSQAMDKHAINTLFDDTAGTQLDAAATYYVQFELQPAKYDYQQKKQSFTIVGMRNLPNSTDYSPLFPDDQALYQPGQLAKSVLEFTLQEETEENRLGQQVLQERGQRWVAATLNFKSYQGLINNNSDWYWEPGLFEDLSWNSTPEAAYPYTSARSLVLQVGYRFCLLQQCYLDTMYRRHPTHAVRAEIMSILVADRESGKIMAEFIREQE